jgi:hypothetical protein
MQLRHLIKTFSLVSLIAYAAHPTWAAGTGSIFISGTVLPKSAISIDAGPGLANSRLGAEAASFKLATITERSNSRAGYTIVLSSENGGSLKSITSAEARPYALSYGGEPVELASGAVVISEVSEATPASGRVRDLAMSFVASELETESFAEVLTFTIVAR